MNESKSVTKDPICGMNVDTTSTFHTERDGKTYHFCSDRCLQDFLHAPAGATSQGKPAGCC